MFSEAIKDARPRVMAALTAVLCDLDLAEDCFQDACVRALETWPESGLPQRPDAWLIRVARNRAIDVWRSTRPRGTLEDRPSPLEASPEALLDAQPFGDDVLRLMFLCCHPSLQPKDQVALALRILTGMTLAEIAKAFLVAPRAMEQRLTRAKRRLREVVSTLETPDPRERRDRVAAVIAMIYLLFNEGYAGSHGPDPVRRPLCHEAIRLARLLLSLLPDDPEVMGLLALCLLQDARSETRLDSDGRLVLLADQDRARWDERKIAAGTALLEKALQQKQPGPIQIQAAIAAVHNQARSADETDWVEITRLYALLARLQDSPLVQLNRAVAAAEAYGVAAGLAVAEPLAQALDGYFYFHGTLAGFYARLGRDTAARAAFERALTLVPTDAHRDHLHHEMKKFHLF
ncbi:Sigma-70 family RNA polymerase sigma factor [Acanthopleuribacter pedis]|nr:sigma-70 family RNA polymerase sigma factor [Acanthopleuribacter pedis]